MSDSLQIGKKPGRPPDLRRAFWRQQMGPEWSERTFARFYRAVSVFHEHGDDDALGAAFTAATRANGSINVSKLERLADAYVMRRVLATADAA